MASPGKRSPAFLPDLGGYAAVLFDLDGVLTPTADVHMRAWAEMFTRELAARDAAPYGERDYFDHLDGRHRYAGADSLLRSRGIELPWGDPADPPEAETVCGLGNRKNAVFMGILAEEGVAPYPGSLLLANALRERGTPMAIVSSSRNARTVLAAAGLEDFFPVVIDGIDVEREGMAGKPAPDAFLAAADLLGAGPDSCVVVEDAIAGVAAGRAGAFGLVVGVDRGVGVATLRDAGADLVVDDLRDLAAAAGLPALDAATFPPDPWRLVETTPPPPAMGQNETIFAVGNGWLGMRGNAEEGFEAYDHGTYLNGFHETHRIRYPEGAYGYAEVGQTIVNVPDAKTIRLEVDGDQLDLADAAVSDYARTLDFADGVLRRSLVWITRDGNRVQVESSRMTSFHDRHLALFTFRVTLLDAPARVKLTSLLVNRQDGQGERSAAGAPRAGRTEGRDAAATFDPRRGDRLDERVLEPAGHAADGDTFALSWRTASSRMSLAVAGAHELKAAARAHTDYGLDEDGGATAFSLDAVPGEPVELVKLVAYYASTAMEPAELMARAQEALARASALGAAELFRLQRAHMDTFWADADVEVGADAVVQQAVRWNLFQLAQASERAEGAGVSAKGVSGSGYSGHYFWDTEIYVLPFLTYTRPHAAREALGLRHRMLPAARRRARVMNQAGALFPWRTINGEEASAYYPAGTAQYHIDADVTYALARYVRTTGDERFLADAGIDIAVETARMWASLGFFTGSPERFHIHAVTGPDEYSAVANDNYYTNVMAQYNLAWAAAALDDLARHDPAAHARAIERLGIAPDEPAAWRRAAAAMELPFDPELGVHAQDDSFLKRRPWDLAATPAEKRPLLLHFHPLVIYRHRVLKQADLVLALFLHSRLFTLAEKRADFDFYDPLTSGDSTLSAAVQSTIAAEVGHPALALRYFRQMLFVDLCDLHGNADHGVHIASTGGVWSTLVCGFGGLRDDTDGFDPDLRLDPRLPDSWDYLRYRLRVRGSRLRVTLRRDVVELEVDEGDAVTLSVQGRRVTIAMGEPVSVALQPPAG